MSKADEKMLGSALSLMLSAVKNTELYPMGHPSVQKPFSDCFKALSELIALDGVLTLGIVDEVLVFGGVPFYPNQVSAKEMQERLERRGVSALEIHYGLSEQEFQGFVKVLTEDPRVLAGEGQFSESLRERNIKNIVAKDAKEVYNRALDAVGDVFQETRLGRIPKAGKARSAAADLKRMVLADRTALIGLTLIKSYDSYLFNHSVNVSVLALALAQGLQVQDEDISDIGLAGLLHDVGKTLTPKAVTLKPGNLTEEEWEVMKQHPLKSAEIVEQMEGVSGMVARIVKEHHVHFDHRGYPQLEPGEHPHPYSRIVTVADTYDAITTLRPYQKPYNPREAMEVLERLSGKVIDPKYFEEFVKVLGIFPVGTLVRLDTNEVAVVTETCEDSPLSPRIRVVFDPEGKPMPAFQEFDLSRPETYKGEPRRIVSTVDPVLYNVEPGALL